MNGPTIERIPLASPENAHESAHEHARGPTYCETTGGGDTWTPCGFCAVCGMPLQGPQIRYCGKAHRRWWRDNHVWTDARRAAMQRDYWRCTEPGCDATYPASSLEAHHIEPRDGAALGATSCRNHQDNLTTLCGEHHREVAL